MDHAPYATLPILLKDLANGGLIREVRLVVVDLGRVEVLSAGVGGQLVACDLL